MLEQISHSLNNHLFDTNRHLSVWAEYNKQHNAQSSDNYRYFEEDSELKQLAVSVPFGEIKPLNLGVIISDARSSGIFDDNINYKNTTKMISGFAQLNVDDKLFAELDLGLGNSHSAVNLDGENNSFKRNIASAGIRLGYSTEAFGLKVQPSVGLRYHYLGAMNYRLADAEVKSGQLNIAGLQAGIRVEKSFLIGRTSLAPYFASDYRDMNLQTHRIAVNDRPLTQQFGRHFRHEVGLNTNYAQWHFSINAGTVSGNETAKQHYAGVKLKYRW